MTVSHGQQTEFRFPGKKEESRPERASRKRNAHKRTKEKGKPERKGTRRRRRVESAGSKTVQKAAKQEGEKKEASITFPLRLSASEHAEWRKFAKQKRYSLHQFVKNAVEDLLSRIRQGKSISWLELG